MDILFDDGWRFTKLTWSAKDEEILRAPDWQDVDLPHDWMIYNTDDLYEEAKTGYKRIINKNNYPQIGENSHVSLIFQGVYMESEIYFNNEHIFTWKYGYSEFEVDITNYLTGQDDEIVVINTYRLPNSRWYPGSGIYRDVHLHISEDVRIPHRGTYVSTKKLGKTWEVLIDTEYVCDVDLNREYIIRHTLYDADDEGIICHEHRVKPDTEPEVDKQVLTVIDPKLWDVREVNLYELETCILDEDRVVDMVCQKVGFRTIEFSPDEGFFLNGRNLKINGTCEHHVLGALGAAANKAALRRQLSILKGMGVNSIRSAHNMPSDDMLELCDEMGLLLYTESFDTWEKHKTDYDYATDFKEWWKKDLTSWVRQDRNHPCVFIWGIGNEIYDTHFERGTEVARELHEAVRELDYRKNGFTAIGSNYIEWENAQIAAKEADLSGYNYMDKCYDEHHEKYPDWIIFGSETSSTLQSRGVYHFPLENRLLTFDDLQCSSLGNCTTNWGAKNSEHAIIVHRDRDFVFGQYLWSGFDYIGEPTPYFTKNSYFGQVDTAGFVKDSYYMYKSAWVSYKEEPFVHILPYWDFNEGQIIDVRLFSNAPEVELIFNGESLGKKAIDHEKGTVLSADYKLSYTKGKLEALAYDEEGNLIANDVQSSFGDPEKIVLEADRAEIDADGRDLVYISVSAVDAEGIFVANARNRIDIEVSGEGRLIGMDNGDSSDFDNYKDVSRKLFSGRLVAIIQSNTRAGRIKVKATSKGLEGAEIDIKAKEINNIEGVSTLLSNKRCSLGERIWEKDGKEIVIPDRNGEVPIRKIELGCEGEFELSPHNIKAVVNAKILPVNATYKDITFKAVTSNGVISNACEVSYDTEKKQAIVEARGDGEFKLLACANNGLDHAEVISELEFEVKEMGSATFDPYKMVSAIDNYCCSDEGAKLSFDGGIYITSNERTVVTFTDVDMGEYGSDEIHLPIFSFEDSLDIEVWQGIPDEGLGENAGAGEAASEGKNAGTGENEAAICLAKGTYKAKSWYNHYQENVFKLDKRLKGVVTLSIVVYPHVKMSLQGFTFTKLDKAYSRLLGSDAGSVTGDSFAINGSNIEEIGNNVTITFDNLDFGEEGFGKLRVCGHSHIDLNTIHVRFENCHEEVEPVNNIIEFPYSEGYVEKEFEIESVKGCNNCNLIFMPGSKFDLAWIEFCK